MTPALSPNTKAILLLTAPLLAGRGSSTADLLSPGEYRRLARHLRELQRQPADLLSPGAEELLHACHAVVEQSRLQRLTMRGFLLSQVIERWQARAIWVVSRADSDYPGRVKARLRDDAPAVLYGCGDIGLLETGGLAVVGSRHADEALIDYTVAVGRLAARAHTTLISGGAKGIDQAAMRGALEAGGRAIGVLADSLEKTALNREHRDLLIDDRLVLISPYDPGAGFNVGNAMQRNKLIYALADVSLVVSSDLEKGGTWAGATEQLDKLRLVPVYVRSSGDVSDGLNSLRQKGALPWPNPEDEDAFLAMFGVPMLTSPAVTQVGLPLFSSGTPPVSGPGTKPPVMSETQSPLVAAEKPLPPVDAFPEVQLKAQTAAPSPSVTQEAEAEPGVGNIPSMAEISPADALFTRVREVAERLLKAPMKDAEVAAALDVSTAQAKVWLRRLVDEGVLQKQKRLGTYIAKQPWLFQ